MNAVLDDLPDMLWVEDAPHEIAVRWMIENLISPLPGKTMIKLYDRKIYGVRVPRTSVFPIAPRPMARAGFVFHKSPDPALWLTGSFPFDWIGDV